MSETVSIRLDIPAELAREIDREFDRRKARVESELDGERAEHLSAKLDTDGSGSTAVKALGLLAAATDFDTEEV